MKITVTRSGGFAGLTRKWSATVTEEAETKQWRELLDQLPWDQVTSKPAEPAEPDRFIYRVRCANRQAVVPEQRFTGVWQQLLDRVREADETHQPSGPHRD